MPKSAISFIANTVYHEKYCTKKMKHSIAEIKNEMTLNYQWRHQNKWNTMEAVIEKPAQSMVLGSEEEFIAEHYWGYSKYNDTTTYEYHVQHPVWKIFPVKSYSIDCDFTSLYGAEFSELMNAKPNSVFVAEGSEVAVLKKRNL